jgi:hypothetical protein
MDEKYTNKKCLQKSYTNKVFSKPLLISSPLFTSQSQTTKTSLTHILIPKLK